MTGLSFLLRRIPMISVFSYWFESKNRCSTGKKVSHFGNTKCTSRIRLSTLYFCLWTFRSCFIWEKHQLPADQIGKAFSGTKWIDASRWTSTFSPMKIAIDKVFQPSFTSLFKFCVSAVSIVYICRETACAMESVQQLSDRRMFFAIFCPKNDDKTDK